MGNKSQQSVSQLFAEATEGELLVTIHGLVNTILANNSKTRAFFNRLSGPEKQAFEKARNRAMMGQSTAQRYMTDLGKHYALSDDRDPVYRAKPKDLDRAAAKAADSTRRQDDLARGTLYFDDADDLLAFTRNIYVKGKARRENYIPYLANDDETKILRIREPWINRKKPGKQAGYDPGSLDELIAFPRSNGYSGVIAFSVLSDLRKSGAKKTNPNKAPFEVRLMLRADQETDKHSHALYKLMRQLKETPKHYQTKGEEAVMKALIEGNRALWDVSGYDTGLLYGRSVPPIELKSKDAEAAIEILEKFMYYLTPRLGHKGARLLHKFINSEFPDDRDKDNVMAILQAKEMNELDFKAILERIENSTLDDTEILDLKCALGKQKKKWDESSDLLQALDATRFAINRKVLLMPSMLKDYKKYADQSRRFDPPEETSIPELQT